ncbi:MAG: class I SAM-dependent methyltransferase [Deltaproteobacteria bacterium]|nr:class I SAM-dependent methyltransferase [Deltaproteobacteria bacterium]
MHPAADSIGTTPPPEGGAEPDRPSRPPAAPPEEETADFGYRRIPAREKPGFVLGHFDAIAGKYDFMNTLLSLGLHRRWKRRAVEALKLAPGERVIDVCGGTGDLALLASRALGPRGSVVLYDFSRAMIAAGSAKRRYSSRRAPIQAVQGDAEQLAFPEESFDAAMVGFGIRNLTHMDQGLTEMHRVLKPGGRLMCLEFSLPLSDAFRRLYDFYSFRLMPLAGLLLAGNRAAYLHLPESIRRFPPPEKVAGLLSRIGFAGVTYRRLMNGIVVLYGGVKR